MSIWGTTPLGGRDAAVIAEDQAAEAQQLQGWLRDWYGVEFDGKSPSGPLQQLLKAVHNIRLDVGKVIDKSQGGGSIACCGRDENANHNSTSIPSGVRVDVGGGDQGEWGRHPQRQAGRRCGDIDEKGQVWAWTVQPSCTAARVVQLARAVAT